MMTMTSPTDGGRTRATGRNALMTTTPVATATATAPTPTSAAAAAAPSAFPVTVSASMNVALTPHNSNNHPNNNNNNNNNTPQIRHAGRAHVRGKIRRVWRPRYMELCDSGYVQYYELPATANLTAAATDASHVHMIPKYTLAVHHARILDVTTLRDMHVGLPQGAYGFVFRGHRFVHTDPSLPVATPGTSTDNKSANQSMWSATNSSLATATATATDPYPWQYMHPVSSPLVLPSASAGIGGPGAGPGGGSGSANPYPSCHEATKAPEQRDFLCAVATLEEAQVWVVALQWAAHRQRLPRSTMEPWWWQQEDDDEDNDHHVRDHRNHHHHHHNHMVDLEEDGLVVLQLTPNEPAAPTRLGSHESTILPSSVSHANNPPQRSMSGDAPSSSSMKLNRIESTGSLSGSRRSACDPPLRDASVASSFSSVMVAKSTSGSSLHHNRAAAPSTRSKSSQLLQNDTSTPAPTTGKTVVSKVVQYRIVRLGGWWNFEIAYEIQAILIRMVERNTAHVQQFCLWRTAADLLSLVTALCKELGPTLLDRAQLGPIRQLPLLQERPTPTMLHQSCATVDSIVRSLVMDADMLNSAAMKHFLGLHPGAYSEANQRSKAATRSDWLHRQLQPVLRCLQVHRGNSTVFLESSSWHISAAKVSTSSSSGTDVKPSYPSVDALVKDWLQTTSRAPQSIMHLFAASFLWQRPPWWLLACATSLTTALAWPCWRLWQLQHATIREAGTATASMLPTMSMRLDTLVFSWIGAAYLGYMVPKFVSGHMNNGASGSNNKRRMNAHRSKSTSSSGRRSLRAKPPNTSGSTGFGSSNREVGSMEMLPKSSDPPTSRTHVASSSDSTEVDSSRLEQLNDDAEETNGADEENGEDEESDGEEAATNLHISVVSGLSCPEDQLTSPLPQYPGNGGVSCWSQPPSTIFHVRGSNYLHDRVKVPSGPAPLQCRGVDVWMTDNPSRHIARHPAILSAKLSHEDTFLVNFLLPFGNLVAYFAIPPLEQFPEKLRSVWINFLAGDQQYRDARLKLLPVVVDGPWIVKAAVGPGKSPALLGKVIPLQYFFRRGNGQGKKGIYEVDVIITASSIAKGILSVVKGHTKSVTIAFAFIIEAALQEELPETVLCSFQVHSLHLEDCPLLPPWRQASPSHATGSPSMIIPP